MQRVEKAVVRGATSPVRPLIRAVGAGRIVWSPLPLEVGDSMTALAAFYRLALTQARVAARFTALPRTPAVLVLPAVFRDVVLYTFVSEMHGDTRMQITDRETGARFSVVVPAERTALVLVDREDCGSVLARL